MVDDLTWIMHLSTLLVVTNTDVALRVEAVRPEATEVDVGLRHAGVAEEEPETENGLGEDIKNSVGDDLSVNAGLAGTVSNTPDAVTKLVRAYSRIEF